MATLFLWFVRSLRQRAANDTRITDTDAARLSRYLCASEARISSGSSLRLEILGLTVRPELAFTLKQPVLEPLTAEYLRTWRDTLGQFLARAPARTDLAVPYLLWRMQSGQEDEVLQFSRRLLRRNPADAVGLWFSGIVLLAADETAEEGLLRLKRSLEGGIERFMPIDAKLRRQIIGTVRP